MGKVKPKCKYGDKCYRKNQQHLDDFDHGDDNKEDKTDLSSENKNDDGESPPKKRTKINHFFKPKASPTTSTGHESNESDDAGHSSGYQRQDDSEDVTPTAPTGQSSGYVRAEDSDTDEDNTGAEDGGSPDSPEDMRENIKNKFLVEMPDDFYDFWEFAKSVNSKSPLDVLKKSLGLQLVGAFDILAGKHKGKKRIGSYSNHWRYYYDPPELQTVVKGDDDTQFHIGYFRDDPSEPPVFMASNSAAENCMLTPRGENIFAAVNWLLEAKMKKMKVKVGDGSTLADLHNKLQSSAKKGGYSLDQRTAGMKARDKKVVCKSFHGAGIVVPVDENEVGYRPVPETPADLKRMFKKIVEASSEEERDKATDPLMEIIMYVQFANDECDYGEGLELGMDMFSYGGESLHKMILNLLPLAYQLLRRPEFGQIIESHLKDRKHSADLSVF